MGDSLKDYKPCAYICKSLVGTMEGKGFVCESRFRYPVIDINN